MPLIYATNASVASKITAPPTLSDIPSGLVKPKLPPIARNAEPAAEPPIICRIIMVTPPAPCQQREE
jgi:hypothetical protein